MTGPGSLQRLHGLGRNDLTFEKNFNRLIGLGDTQVEGHLEEMVESKEWKKLAEFLIACNDTKEDSKALLEVLVEQNGSVEIVEEIFKVSLYLFVIFIQRHNAFVSLSAVVTCCAWFAL